MLLQVKDICKFYAIKENKKPVLENINFNLGSYDSLAIVGPSGSGKSTLLLILAGLIKASKGIVLLENNEISKPIRDIALMLQKYSLFPWKTVKENIIIGAELQKLNIDKNSLNELIKTMDIEGLEEHYPHQLSGGQQQRVAFARILLLEPKLLLLDEPFAALDTITRERLQNHLLELHHKHKFSFIIVTHNIEEALFLGKKVLILKDIESNENQKYIDNPNMGTTDFRNTTEFFNLTKELRKIMEVGL